MGTIAKALELGAQLYVDGAIDGSAVTSTAVGALIDASNVYRRVVAERSTAIIDFLVHEHPSASEDDIAQLLVLEHARESAEQFRPLHEASGGVLGRVCVELSPKLWRNPNAMQQRAQELAHHKNLVVSIPATPHGLSLMRELSPQLAINATHVGTLAQVQQVADALLWHGQRKPGRHSMTFSVSGMDAYVEQDIGSTDTLVDPGHLNHAGIALVRAAYRTLSERDDPLLVVVKDHAHLLHLTHLLGPATAHALTAEFAGRIDTSPALLRETIEDEVHPAIVASLAQSSAARRALQLQSLEPEDDGRPRRTPAPRELLPYTRSSLFRSLSEADELTALVRERMLPVR